MSLLFKEKIRAVYPGESILPRNCRWIELWKVVDKFDYTA